MLRIGLFKHIIFLIIFIWVFSSCNTSVIRPPKPKNLVSESVMAEVLADIHIAEASIMLSNSEEDTIHQTYVNYYNAVFQKHNISNTQFSESMEYYIRNPILLQKIYEDVTEILSTKRGVKM